jgi:tetratricopeptide (TPR) repeat protein
MKPSEVPDLPRALAREIERTAKHPDDTARAMAKYLRARERGRTLDALHALERAKEHAPRTPSVREGLGLVLLELERWRDAVAELTTYRRLTGDPKHDVRIAEADHRSGRSDRALERLEHTIAEPPSPAADLAAHATRIRVYAEQGRADLAQGLLESARRKFATPAARAVLDRVAESLTR